MLRCVRIVVVSDPVPELVSRFVRSNYIVDLSTHRATYKIGSLQRLVAHRTAFGIHHLNGITIALVGYECSEDKLLEGIDELHCRNTILLSRGEIDEYDAQPLSHCPMAMWLDNTSIEGRSHAYEIRVWWMHAEPRGPIITIEEHRV